MEDEKRHYSQSGDVTVGLDADSLLLLDIAKKKTITLISPGVNPS